MQLDKVDWSQIRQFKKEDVNCSCCGSDYIAHQIMILADLIRDKFGPITITSGVRCTLRNVAAGGARDSYHIAMPKRGILGMAVDFRPFPFHNPNQLTRLHEVTLEVLGGLYGCILEESWIHCDIRETSYRATKEPIW